VVTVSAFRLTISPAALLVSVPLNVRVAPLSPCNRPLFVSAPVVMPSVALKDRIPEEQWVDKRVVWDPRVNLLTSQGPGTSIDFALKIIQLLVGREKSHEVASQLVMAAGIYNFYE
jgi:putative intracellular protease/amidase